MKPSFTSTHLDFCPVCHSHHDFPLVGDFLHFPDTFFLSSNQDKEVFRRFRSSSSSSSSSPGPLPVNTHIPSVRPAPLKQTKIISFTHSHLAYCTREQSLRSLTVLPQTLRHPIQSVNTLLLCEYTPRSRCRHSGLFERGTESGL